MTRGLRIAAAYILSVIACGTAQYATIVMSAGHDHYPLKALFEIFPPLLVAVLLVTTLFVLAIQCGPYAGRLTLILLPLMAAAGYALYVSGVNSRSSGADGNLFYAVNMIVVFYYLAPCALAVPVHWLMLRRG
jgi:hypothetical protein